MSLDIDAYLARIGYHGPRAPTLEGLRALQRLHPAAIPFENLDARFGVTPKLDIASVQAKLVGQRRGGYCFEQNALYQAALDTLGFQTRALIGRVRWRQPDAAETGRTHRLVLVTIDGEDWITDVGFGGLVLTAPLRLEADVAQETPHETFRLVRRGSGFEQQALLGDVWSPTYRFDLEPAPTIDFEIGNWFCATNPQSHFTFNLNVSRAAPEGRLTLLNTDFGRRDLGGEVQRRQLETADELADVLRSEFLLEPPPYADLDAVVRAAARD
jgi:N-hydroxyarylamine O-acetyltransferase